MQPLQITPLMKYCDLSKYLQRSEDALRRDVMLKRIPFVRIGRSIRFSKEQIDKFIAAQTIEVER